jgi:osmotically-inducible protein OsmY
MQKRTDSQIQEDVLRELRWDTRVAETEVGVQVQDGVVTLTGAVESWGKRLAAQDAAHRVTGVLDVANDLEVKLVGASHRTDTEIARAVRHALEWDVFVPDARIQSTVSNGWITLEGSVDGTPEREDAERAVRNLAGVRGVTNRITVSPAIRVPANVKHAIEEALARRAQREARQIEVSVESGRVRLSGYVHSFAEKEAVVGAARFAPGVVVVEAQLRIDPYH